MLLLIFFVPLFFWIAFGFVTSAVGFLKLITGEHPGFTAIPAPASALRHRTAVLMPVYNEERGGDFCPRSRHDALDRRSGRRTNGSISSF